MRMSWLSHISARTITRSVNQSSWPGHVLTGVLIFNTGGGWLIDRSVLFPYKKTTQSFKKIKYWNHPASMPHSPRCTPYFPISRGCSTTEKKKKTNAKCLFSYIISNITANVWLRHRDQAFLYTSQKIWETVDFCKAYWRFLGPVTLFQKWSGRVRRSKSSKCVVLLKRIPGFETRLTPWMTVKTERHRWGQNLRQNSTY
jgi:hypothetical protein